MTGKTSISSVGTAAVVLSGLFGALRISGKKLIENTFLFVGAGQVCSLIADTISTLSF